MMKFFNKTWNKNFCKFIDIKERIKQERLKRLGLKNYEQTENKESDNIRNISIVAHIDAGKTTLTERILYYSGIIPYFGEVHEGNTKMDYMEQERERGITIRSAIISLNWQNTNINLVDTPGHVDFGFEVERALKVSDSCIVILDSSVGVQAQTETVWRQANKYSLSKLVFLNKFDKVGSSLDNSIISLKDKIGIQPLVMNVYIDEDNILDVITGKIYKFLDNEGKNIEIYDIEEGSKLNEIRTKYLEDIISELLVYDNSILDLYMENNMIYIKKIYENLHKILKDKSDKFCLLFCGTALKNRGIQFLLDAIVKYLPSPNNIENLSMLNEHNNIVEVNSNINELIMFCFKIQNFKDLGLVYLFRVFTGNIKSRDILINSNKLSNEKINNLYKINANELEKINNAKKGDIVGVSGLNNVKSGDTLISSKISNNLKFEDNKDITFVFSSTVLFEKKKDKEKIIKYLENYRLEDPSFNFKKDTETGEILFEGLGELHLQVYQQRLETEHNIKINLENLKVYFKETILGSSNKNYILNKTFNNSIQYMDLNIQTSSNLNNENKEGFSSSGKSYVINLPNNNTIEFSFFKVNDARKNYEYFSDCYFNLGMSTNTLNDIVNTTKLIKIKEIEIDEMTHELYDLSTIKFDILIKIENILRNCFYQGVLLSNEMKNVKIEIKSGFITRNLFDISGISNFIIDSISDSFNNSSPNLLEPMYEIEILTSKDYSNDIIKDLISNRDGKIIDIIDNKNDLNEEIKKTKINAKIPVLSTINYINYLRSLTSGEIIFNLNPIGYDAMNFERSKKLLNSKSN